MLLWLQDFRFFLKERRLGIRILILAMILLFLLTSAFILINSEYSLSTNVGNYENSFTIFSLKIMPLSNINY